MRFLRGARLGDIALATLIDIENSTSFEMLFGARDGTRTHDLLITNQLRYQLRHSSGYSFVMRRGADRRGLPNDYIISCGIFQVIFPDF